MRNLAYVTEYGNWGNGEEIFIFNPEDLTEEQWQNVDELPDSQKLSYVQETLRGY
jgi:hypothetical protein